MKDYQQIYQGDIWVMKLPDTLKVTLEAEIPQRLGKLIVQEGEMTGHHHYVDTVERKPETEDDVDFSALDIKSLKALFTKRDEPRATFYSATKVAEQLVKEGILLRADLVIGLLKVENGPMMLNHQEHGSVPLSPGKYAVGRQIESVAGEERRVAD